MRRRAHTPARTKANYTAEGAKGSAHDGGTARRAAIEQNARKCGRPARCVLLRVRRHRPVRNHRSAGSFGGCGGGPHRRAIRKGFDEDHRAVDAGGDGRGVPKAGRLSAAGWLVRAPTTRQDLPPRSKLIGGRAAFQCGQLELESGPFARRNLIARAAIGLVSRRFYLDRSWLRLARSATVAVRPDAAIGLSRNRSLALSWRWKARAASRMGTNGRDPYLLEPGPLREDGLSSLLRTSHLRSSSKMNMPVAKGMTKPQTSCPIGAVPRRAFPQGV